jgi:hypothetical protein
MVGASFDEFCRSLPPELSGQFVSGFREALLHLWRGA